MIVTLSEFKKASGTVTFGAFWRKSLKVTRETYLNYWILLKNLEILLLLLAEIFIFFWLLLTLLHLIALLLFSYYLLGIFFLLDINYLLYFRD